MSETKNSLEINVPCPNCGQATPITITMDEGLDYVWDSTSLCLECGKMFVFVSRVTAKTYTINMPDEDWPVKL